MYKKYSYGPYVVGHLLSRRVDTFVEGVRVSKFGIMNYMMRKKLVQVKKTKLYKVDSFVAMGLIPQDSTWTEIAKYGRDALLTPRQVMDLIMEVKFDTQGGSTMSGSELRKKISIYIYTVYSKKGLTHSLSTIIPVHTLDSLVSTIKAQCLFSIYDSVANKTESSAVAEWSLRSTLGYAMVVAVNHYIPNVEQSYFHPKEKDLNKDSLELWDIAESAYNKMIGDKTNKSKLFPVFPHLVTTTDEVTLFATSGTIHNKEKFFIVAKPDQLKNISCHSGCRNHYKKKPSRDAHCRGVRIVVNSTFTAGGIAAPIFFSVFGLTKEEMPGDKMITIKIPGLTCGSHQDLYSNGEEFINFVRGCCNQK